MENKKVPLKVERKESEGLQITWHPNTPPILIGADLLRKSCPCASCKEARGEGSHDTPLTPKKRSLQVISHTLSEQLTLKEIWPVGNYALGVRWADGHDDGIYPYSLLSELSQRAN